MISHSCNSPCLFFPSERVRELREDDAAHGGVEALLADLARVDRVLDAQVNLLLVRVLVADEDDVRARPDGVRARLPQRHMLGDRAHLEIIREDDALVPQLPAQKIRHDGARLRGGVRGVVAGVDEMRDEDQIAFRLMRPDDLRKGHEVFFLHRLARGLHARDFLVRVDRALADAREMLERAEHPLLLVALGRLARKERHGRRVAGKRARVPRADIHDGREVQIDADRPERPRRLGRGVSRALRLPGRADGRLGLRRGDNALAARDGAALLIDGEEERRFLLRLALRVRLQVLAQRLELLLRLNVAVEIDHAADMELPQHGLAVLVDVLAVDADHDHLADFLIRRHLRDDRVGSLLERPRLRLPPAAAGEQSHSQQSRAQQSAERHTAAPLFPHVPTPPIPLSSARRRAPSGSQRQRTAIFPRSAPPRLLGEAVARPAHSLDVDGLCGVWLDLLPDVADVHHDGRVVADGVEAPDAREEALAAEDDAGMLREEGEELELEVRERDLAPALGHASARRVDDEIAAHEGRRDLRASLCRRAPAPRGLADARVAREARLDAGDELVGAERLDEVVVGAEAEAADLVDVLALRRRHEDGHFALRADLAADGEAVEPRQHEVEHDEAVGRVRRALCRRRGERRRQALPPVRGEIDGEALRLEIVALELADVLIVLDDQDALHTVVPLL